MDEISYKDLKQLFLDDPLISIEYSQIIICSVANFNTFRDFSDFHIHNSHISTCQKEWTHQMSIHCNKCSTVPNSCVCLQCFLNGNHQGHDYTISTKSCGNCDCGDLSQWKHQGFCPLHPGIDEDSHPENYIDEKLRNILTDVVFKACFTAIKHLQPEDTENLEIILKFLRSFLSFGDGFRRLLSISLTERVNFEKFFNIIFSASLNFNSILQHFLGFFCNDQLFKEKFIQLSYKLMMDKIIPEYFDFLEIRENIQPFNNMWFHAYVPKNMQKQIDLNGWNWTDFIIQLLKHMKNLFLFAHQSSFTNQFPTIFTHQMHFNAVIQKQPIEKVQNFFDLFVSEILSNDIKEGIKINPNDTTIVTSFNEENNNNLLIIYRFNTYFYRIVDSFKSQKDLIIDSLFDELEKSFDITQLFLIGKNDFGDVNDKFIKKFFQENDQKIEEIDYYKSFQNGSSFFLSNILLFTLMHFIRNDDFCRAKVAKFLSTEKYQSLRIKLAIASLKSLVARFCCYQSLVKTANSKLVNFLKINEEPNSASGGISLLIPLLQLTIGLQCNDNDEFSIKEFFAFEIAREIGLFDNDNEEKMYFSFLYIIILLVIERTLFKFDGYQFIKEQITFNLKIGVTYLNQLSNLYDPFAKMSLRDDVFDEIISEVANARQSNNLHGNQDVTFFLKDGIEINPISAINPINNLIELMNNNIKKNPNELLKIQSFEPEETYFFDSQNDEEKNLNIRLKELFFTPTVLAVIYKVLRKDSENHKVSLNEHLAMNILVWISKFTVDDSESQELKETTIDYDSSLFDLISQLKRVVFNYNVDENDNATIEYSLSKKGFDSFLKIKIGSDDESPKSFIDILLEKGEIGRSVLTQMSVEVEGNNNEKEDENYKLKKLCAKKLKEDILSQFRSSASSFNANDEDELNSNIEKEACSVCSVLRKNEVLCHPLYFYKTKFPFIFDKPPLVKLQSLNASREIEIHKDSENNNNDDDDENYFYDENDEFPSIDDILVNFMNNNPSLDITRDLSETEIQRRKSKIDEMTKCIVDNYEQIKQIFEESNDKNLQKQQRKILLNLKADQDIKKQLDSIKLDSFVTKRITAGNSFVVQFGTCHHLVHHDCVINGFRQRGNWKCPICRLNRNGFLPNIDDLTNDSIFANESNTSSEVNSENLSDELKGALNLFIRNYSNFVKSKNDKIVDVFVELVKSISGLIVTYEVRLRSLPDCLDSKKSKYLPRNLFLATWYTYRYMGKPKMKTGFNDDVSEDVDSKLSIFQRFIKCLIECDELEGVVDEQIKTQKLQEITSSFAKSFDNEKELFLFLKRVCLADYFLLKKKDISNEDNDEESKFIDWDEILTSENLSQRYKILLNKLNGFEFRPFVFSKIPKEFIRFAQNPYNFPVDQTMQVTLFNILDYNNLIQNYNDFCEDDNSIFYSDYLNELTVTDYKNLDSTLRYLFSKQDYPSILLFIGIHASKIRVIYKDNYQELKPFYLDKFGCTDIGFEREKPLFLNEERYERVMDEILSGDFTNTLISF